MSTYDWIQQQAAGLPTYMGTGYPISTPHAFYVEDFNTVAVWCFPEGESHGKPRTLHMLSKRSGAELHHTSTV